MQQTGLCVPIFPLGEEEEVLCWEDGPALPSTLQVGLSQLQQSVAGSEPLCMMM